MKTLKIGLLFLLVLFITNLKAQSTEWVNKMMSGEHTFKEIQDQFYTDWNGYDFTKGHGWKQFKRWEHFWSTRLMPDGSFPDYSTELESYNTYKSAHITRSLDAGNWTPLGPTNYTSTESWSPGLGRVNCVVEDPNLASTLYIGTPGGGAWKSTNSGTTWIPLSDNLSAIGISAIGIAKTNSQIIYLATGDADGGDTQSIGVIKSTDGGASWAIVGSTTNVPGQLADILVDPIDPNIVYVASRNSGIYKTSNGGANWTKILNGNYRDIEFKPGNSQIIYASNQSRIKFSTNAGSNWSSALGIPSGMSRIALAVTPADDSYVYALIANGTGGYKGVYRSTDSGVNFSAMNTTTDCFEGDQSWYDMAIGASDTDKDVIFTGVLNVWKSTDGGESLEAVNSWSNPSDQAYTHADIHFLRYYNGNLYCGSDGGVYKSTNDGVTFSDLSSGLQIGQFYRISGVESNLNTLTGGLQDNGNYYRAGTDWKVWLGADGMENVINPGNPLEAYGMIQFGGLYKTTDGGQTSTHIGRPNDLNGNWITLMVYDIGLNRIIAGYDKIYQYNGDWTALTTFDFNGNLNCLEVAPSNSQVMYCTVDQKIYKTINNGATVTVVTNNLTSINSSHNDITSIEIHPEDQNKVWVSFGGMTAGVKVAKSIDGGDTWTNVTGTLPNLPCNIVKLDGTSSEVDAIYIGMDIGVYYKDTTHTDFIPFLANLPNVKVMDIEINETNDKIRVGTYGRGICESKTHASVLLVDAGYTTSTVSACTNQPIIFTSTSSGATSYSWNFGANANPATANTVGPHVVTYSSDGVITATLNINSNQSNTTSNITVHPLPTATFNLVDKVCADAAESVNLTAAALGGTFSGAGVSGNIFNPAISGIGTFTISYTIIDGNSCRNSANESIEIESCLGVNQNTLPTVRIYPNPIIDEFRINVTNLNFEYYISDVSGRIIRKGNAYDNEVVNLNQNSPGIYFLTIVVDNKSQTLKIINK